MKKIHVNSLATLFTVNALSLAISTVAYAQEEASSTTADSADSGDIAEEIVTRARLRDLAQDVTMQRMTAEVAVDILGAEMVGRIGDSTVSEALKRLPGVTTVDEKFVFVRGLGERYSKTLVNGAEIPSVDLTRNVIPLDLFPTSVISSLSVQKVHSADVPVHFGGGTVDIRTTGIPSSFFYSIQLGTGINTESDEDFLSYNGGGDDKWGTDDGTRGLSTSITQALNTHLGDFSVEGIRSTPGNQGMSIAEAEIINRQIATELYRDISIVDDSGNPDLSGEFTVGNLFTFDNGVETGFIAGVNYDNSWRNSDITSRVFSNPEEFVEFENESTYNVSLTGHLGVGLRLNDEHYLETTTLYLRNTDDKVTIADTFGADDNRPLSEGVADREYRIRYEERRLLTNQIRGEHELGSLTRDLLGWKALDWLAFADGLKLNWYFSDSTAETEIPSEIGIEAETVADPTTGAALSSTVKAATKANYRFTNLDDELESGGMNLSYPFEMDNFAVTLSGGGDYWKKARLYRQFQFALESDIASGDPILGQALGDIFSDENIANDALGFEIDVTGSNSESYLAASKVDAFFGKADVTWADTLRLVAGARYEEYQQVSLIWDPLEYDGTQISSDPVVLENSTFVNDDTYASFSATWMVRDFWAEDFQLRFGFAETSIRPDLREISDASYIDPLTGATIFGNPDVRPSDINNFDLRAEWFFSSGDNFTVTLFYKDIDNPIEQFEAAAGGTKIAVEIDNAESGEMQGIEFEFLKNLESFGTAYEPFFIQGNLVLLDHELRIGDAGDAPTNLVRGFAGASDHSANVVFGFDSPDTRHSATLTYNVFAERLFSAGRLGTPDSFEQPFQSADLTYSYYPTEKLTFKLKVNNLFNQDVTIEQNDVVVFEEPKGQSFSLSVKYRM